MAHTPKNSETYTFILQKTKKPPDRFFTHILFVSTTILIVGGIFFHSLSRIIKFNIKWIRVPTTDLARKKKEPGGITQIQVNPVGRQEISLSKYTPKTDPLYSAKFQRIGYFTCSLKDWNTQNKLDLTLMVQQS